jgi:cysteine synthase
MTTKLEYEETIPLEEEESYLYQQCLRALGGSLHLSPDATPDEVEYARKRLESLHGQLEDLYRRMQG